MNHKKMTDVIKLINVIDLLGICALTAAAFFFQFYLHELPCPLCLLQRLGLLAIGFGFLLNVHYRIRPHHYVLSLLAAVLTGFVSMRQISLHILPGSGGYGSTLFGLHMYTWVFIVCVAAIVYTAIMLSIWGQYALHQLSDQPIEARNPWIRRLGHFAFILLVVILIANIASTFIQCGFVACPDNPVKYLW